MLSGEECFSDNSTRSGVQAELSENRDQCSGQVMHLKFAGQDKGEKEILKGDLKRCTSAKT